MKTIDAVFMDEQNSIDVKISLEDKSIWLNQEQLAKLFDRHVGASINHAGSKLFAISKLESSEHINFILNRMLKNA